MIFRERRFLSRFDSRRKPRGLPRRPFRERASMRLDKYLKVSRLIKRRTVANEACDAGRVSVNGKTAKASLEVKAGDVIEIGFGERVVRAEVTAVIETTKKENAAEMYRLL